MMQRFLSVSTAFLLAAAPVLAQDGQLVLADNLALKANWAMSGDDAFIGAHAGCYEGLTRVSQDLKVEPALAMEWVLVDPLTWEFKIREGVTFQDGNPLDAKAVSEALNQALKSEVPIRGFSPKQIASVEATGPMTVTIKTIAPLVTLPGSVANPGTAILSPAAYLKDGINPVGTCTGPFEIVEVDPQQYVKVKRFENYWGGKAKLAGGTIRFIPDANTRGTMARSGEAQISRLVPPAAVATLSSGGDLAVLEVNAPRVLELLLNNARAPFDNQKVRQAVRLAIDTAGISNAIFEGKSPPAGDPFRSGQPWEAPNAPVIERDLEKARALLNEAGVDPAALKIEILAYTGKTELRDVAQIIQAMLTEVGFTVNVRVAEYSSIEPDMLSGNYDLALLSRGYMTDVPEPIGYLTADYSCKGSYNISQHCNPEFDTMLAAAASEEDPTSRYRAYGKLAQYVYDNAVTVFLVNETVFDVASSGVTGFTPHPLNYYVFDTDLDAQ
ncbi:ABC transporter substrate-binding protein [Mesorhizobium delmotii]|uniref:ABC transporter, substrate binding protein n=1 Tax=Mesorhizobium delmotii TaxID=1631247 RepID=A0A2P9ARE8_9HYPH|nr:ABC transporter substrate-binding protein [Mesorhizobium delmotii]SJM33726.1 ABC transporter, substrate binding protein [Mesorhizobium delmotii]